jgi:tRNA (guanine-N7-)-methyltransferase
LDWPKDIPIKNFVGIDIKGARFWRGAKTAVDEGLRSFYSNSNRINQSYFLPKMKWTKSGLLSDPQIKYKRTKHRMTNSEFLQLYKSAQKTVL